MPYGPYRNYERPTTPKYSALLSCKLLTIKNFFEGYYYTRNGIIQDGKMKDSSCVRYNLNILQTSVHLWPGKRGICKFRKKISLETVIFGHRCTCFNEIPWKVPPIPSPHPIHVVFSIYALYCTLKAKAENESTLNRGRGGGDFRLSLRCVFEASVPKLLKMIVVHIADFIWVIKWVCLPMVS